MIVVRITVRLVSGEIQAIRTLDEIELVDRERDDPGAVDLGRLELFEIGVGAVDADVVGVEEPEACLLYTSPSPRDGLLSRMQSSA